MLLCSMVLCIQGVVAHSPLILISDNVMQGVDFFFSNRAHALKFINFVQSVVPMRYRSDKQLVSHNEHSSTYNYKYTFSVEIVPICRVSSDTIWQCACTCMATMPLKAATPCGPSYA